MHKFGTLDSAGHDIAFRYPNIWERETTLGPERIVAAPAESQIGLLIALSRVLPEPFGLLYVLLVSRTGHALGRYQSPEPVSRAEMEAFLVGHRFFLESDARHHLWVMSLPGRSTLVYDNHNVLYAYGALPEYERVVRERGLHNTPVQFPVPHSHHYQPEFDCEEIRMLNHWEWQHFPLVEGQDEPN